jgi:hypothetical protein
MKLKEMAGRLTGFSVPVFGVSWQPREPEIAVARRILAFLEDRRVLFNPYHLEVADQCVHSVVEIRHFLTEEIGRLSGDSNLAAHLRGMRAACRKFLNDMHAGSELVLRSRWPEFFTELGVLRASVGIHVAAIALMYGLDVEGELASMLPGPVDEGGV